MIIISARSSETDRITGLETGADDYLAKPFSVQELIARIKALFRRQQAMGQAQSAGEYSGAWPDDRLRWPAACCFTAR
ncbi:hypothetical protein KIF59_19445 [Enterobacter cloacae subsp. cloacae]|nr:hypothetical protein [Enterobacter cloacae subsp. cloacae]